MKIGEALDAEEVVFGDFRFTPTPASADGTAPSSRGSLRITARIIDRKRIELGAGLAETGALEDLATLAKRTWRGRL